MRTSITPLQDRAWGDHWDEATGEKLDMNPHIPKPDPPKEEEKEEKKDEKAEEKKEEEEKEKADENKEKVRNEGRKHEDSTVPEQTDEIALSFQDNKEEDKKE